MHTLLKSVAVVLLLVQSALAQTKGFANELWQTTWREKDGPQTPLPGAPWRPAMWTNGATNADSAPGDIKALAFLCRYGGSCKRGMPERMYNYLKYYDRLEIFPGEKVPAGTLLIADSEGSPTADGYPTKLATNIRAITKKFAQYPCPLQAGDVARDFSFDGTGRMSEIAYFCTSRMWKRAAARVALDGDYVLLSMYLSAPDAQDAQYRAWSLLLNVIRREQPDKKILGLIQGGYAWPLEGAMTADERHRLERFVALGFDGCWVWGVREQAMPVMDDIAALAADSLTTFGDAQKNWAKE